MLTFAAAVFFLVITPGPGVLSAAGVGAAFGFRQGTRYVAGLFFGMNIALLGVISGLAALIFAVPVIRWILMAASLAYLIFLASRIALAGAKIAFIESKKGPGFRAGLMLNLINPKVYAVNTAFFTGFPYAPDNYTFEILTKILIMNAIWIPIHLGWTYAGAALHRLNLSPRTQQRINYAMAASMLAVVALAILAGLSQAATPPQ